MVKKTSENKVKKNASNTASKIDKTEDKIIKNDKVNLDKKSDIKQVKTSEKRINKDSENEKSLKAKKNTKINEKTTKQSNKKSDSKSLKSKTVSKKGSRKSSIATARIIETNPVVITINKKNYLDYFSKQADKVKVLHPIFILGELLPKMSFFVKVYGGGTTGQAEACANAIAKSIVEEFKDNADIRKILRKAGCLTRDPRMVESKKSGLRKARKREQWSKR